MQGCKRWRRRWQASHVFQRPALISFIMLLVLIKSMGAIIVKAQQVGRLPDDEGTYFFAVYVIMHTKQRLIYLGLRK